MKRDLIEVLCCPDCKSDLHVTDGTPDLAEIHTGELQCRRCGVAYPIVHGIPRFVRSDAYAASFSYEWNKWNRVQLDITNGRRESEETFVEKTGFTPEDLRGKLVLDVGCGAGRFLDVASRWGARVVGVDLSFAVEASHRTLGCRANVSVIQADVFRLPLREETFDAIFSLGVLHHSRDTRAAFLRLPKLLKNGGDLAVWLYYYRDRVHNAASDFWRAVLRPLPTMAIYVWSWTLVTFLSWLWAKPVMSREPWSNLRRILPISIHPDRQWRILDTFDWYSPQYQDKDCSPARVLAWCAEGDIRDVRVLSYPTSIRGRRDVARELPPVNLEIPDVRHHRVVVFGAGEGGRAAMKLLRLSAPGSLVALADNDPVKEGMVFDALVVQRFDDIPRESYDFVIIASLPGRQAISAQLRAAGLIMNRDFVTLDQLEMWRDRITEYQLWAA